MVVLRDVLFYEKTKTYIEFENAATTGTIVERKDKEGVQAESKKLQLQAMPWGKVWSGPEHVIFGHDAKRGLQTHTYVTGLDTGVCHGKQSTGIILPDRRLV